MRTNSEQRQDELERYLKDLSTEALLDYTLEAYHAGKRQHENAQYTQAMASNSDYFLARVELKRRLMNKGTAATPPKSESEGMGELETELHEIVCGCIDHDRCEDYGMWDEWRPRLLALIRRREQIAVREFAEKLRKIKKVGPPTPEAIERSKITAPRNWHQLGAEKQRTAYWAAIDAELTHKAENPDGGGE